MSFSDEEIDLAQELDQEALNELVTSTPTTQHTTSLIQLGQTSRGRWGIPVDHIFPHHTHDGATSTPWEEDSLSQPASGVDFYSIGTPNDLSGVAFADGAGSFNDMSFHPLPVSNEFVQHSSPYQFGQLADYQGGHQLDEFEGFDYEGFDYEGGQMEFPVEQQPLSDSVIHQFAEYSDPDRMETFYRDLAKRYDLIETFRWHDIVILVRRFMCRKGPTQMSYNLRAARLAAWMPNFLTAGRLLGQGAYGKVHLMKTNAGKRYVLKREAIKPYLFTAEIIRIIQEKNSMLIGNENANMIHIKGSWISSSQKRFLVFTAMEFADFGILQDYVMKVRGELKDITSIGHPDVRRDLFLLTHNEIYPKEVFYPTLMKGFRHIILRFSKEFLEAMHFLHTNGISHNDLHDENIMIGKGFHIKIGDFGLSAISHPLYKENVFQTSNLERSVEHGIRGFHSYCSDNYDKLKTVNFLQYVSTGISTQELIIISFDNNTVRQIIHPDYKDLLFYDEFLSHFSDVLVKVANLTVQEPWHRLAQEELAVFTRRYGEEYENYDPKAYILELYGTEKYNENLESKLDVTTEEDIFPEHEEAYWQRAGIGYLDDSFIREMGQQGDVH